MYGRRLNSSTDTLSQESEPLGSKTPRTSVILFKEKTRVGLRWPRRTTDSPIRKKGQNHKNDSLDSILEMMESNLSLGENLSHEI